MPYELVVRNAVVVEEEGVWHGGVAVQEGRIATRFTAESEPEADVVIDAQGMLLLPGLIDIHVHFNDPGRAEWEGFASGSASAAAGGVTTVIDMPLNNDPAATDGATLAAKRAAIAGRSAVDYGLWGGLVTDNVAQLAELDAAGALAYKAFMSNSGIDDFAAVTAEVLRAGLAHAAHSRRFVAVHAESEELTARLTAELRAAGRTDRRAWLESRPPEAELEAIALALRLAEETGGRLHIVHVSTAEGIDLVTAARQAGVAVTCETCPHYLALDSDDFVALGPVAKCAPPLRSRAAVEALWQRVLSGAVDLIASDHSPCPTADKTRGADDIWQAWGGISGVQTLLPILLREGVAQRGMPLPLLARLTSANPARLFGLYPRKGSLQIAADADMVLVAPDDDYVLQPETLLFRHQHSPFVGRTLRGRVQMTLLRGQVVYREGAIVAPESGVLLGV